MRRSLFALLIPLVLALAIPVSAQTATCKSSVSGSTVTVQSRADSTCKVTLSGSRVVRTISVAAPVKPPVVTPPVVTQPPAPPVVVPPVVTPPVVAPPVVTVSKDSEPVFASGKTLLFADEFDSYTGLPDAVKNGWRCTNATTVQDVTTNPAGACQIINGGSNGTGRAMRLVYDGKSTGDGQEAHAWSRVMPDAITGTPGHAFYMTYYFRINPGAGSTLDARSPQRVVQIKWIELWKGDGSDRAQFSTSSSYCTNDVPMAGASGTGTMWNFFARAAGASPMKCQGGQVRPPFAYQGAGQWHRITHKYVTQSAPGARDGLAQMWYDGTLILSVAKNYCGVPVPGRPATSTQNWCETPDLDSFFTNEIVSKFTLGSVMTNANLWPFSVDYDHMSIWRDP